MVTAGASRQCAPGCRRGSTARPGGRKMAADSVLPLLVAAAVFARTAPRAVRAASAPRAVLRAGPAANEQYPATAEAQWDPGPPGPNAYDEYDALPEERADANRDEDPGRFQDAVGPTGNDAVIAAQGRPQRPEDITEQLAEQRWEPVEDSEAVASEALPAPAPLSGRGPPLGLSVDDVDYLTVLRPPQAPQRASPGKGAARKPVRKAAAKPSKRKPGNKGIKQAAKQQKGGKGGNRQRQKGPQGAQGPQGTQGRPSGPHDVAPSPASSYSDPSYLPYDPRTPPHPYGYGYGYYDYPRYTDPAMGPAMGHEYPQATSYPEEERFRPMLSSMASPITPIASPIPPMASPMTPLMGIDPYMPYHGGLGDFPLAVHDQRPSGSGAVQVSQSVPIVEQHSTSNSWPGGASTTTPSATATTTPTPDPAATRKATLKDILLQDCPGAEELGYCDSPPRYPMQQVAEAIERCSELVDHMYAPPPDDRDPDDTSEGEGACQAVRRTLRPGYVRDVASGRWLVALQARGRVVQKVAVERCGAVGRPCARLADSKCARNLGFRNGARSTSCEQRTALLPVITWDPEAPAACPRVRAARFPVACVCRVS